MPSMEIQISTEAHSALKLRAVREAKQMKRLVAEIVEGTLLPSSASSTEVPAASTDRAADALPKDTGRVSGPFTCMRCTQDTDNDDDICDDCRAESRPPTPPGDHE